MLKKLGTVEGEEQLLEVLQRFRNVFSDTPGKIKNFVGKIIVEPNAPIVKKSYPIPFSK